MIRSNGIILQFSSSLLVCFAAYNFQVKAQSFLAACLEAQGFDRIHRGRAIRWIQRRKNGNHSSRAMDIAAIFQLVSMPLKNGGMGARLTRPQKP